MMKVMEGINRSDVQHTTAEHAEKRDTEGVKPDVDGEYPTIPLPEEFSDEFGKQRNATRCIPSDIIGKDQSGSWFCVSTGGSLRGGAEDVLRVAGAYEQVAAVQPGDHLHTGGAVDAALRGGIEEGLIQPVQVDHPPQELQVRRAGALGQGMVARDPFPLPDQIMAPCPGLESGLLQARREVHSGPFPACSMAGVHSPPITACSNSRARAPWPTPEHDGMIGQSTMLSITSELRQSTTRCLGPPQTLLSSWMQKIPTG